MVGTVATAEAGDACCAVGLHNVGPLPSVVAVAVAVAIAAVGCCANGIMGGKVTPAGGGIPCC